MDNENKVRPSEATEALKQLELGERYSLKTITTIGNLTGAETIPQATNNADVIREVAQETNKK